jgi:ATP-dependent helicase/nuclease subunit A
MSISDIKHMFMKLEYEEEGLAEKISYEKKNTEELISSKNGALRGNAYHRAFELFDYERDILSESDVESMLKDILAKGLIDEEYISLINPTKFCKFASSDLGKRMKKAYIEGKLFREKPFVMGIKACEIDPEKYQSEELVVVQGIIDAWFIEDGEIVVVDYKTDSVNNIKDLDARYRSQLEYYGKALADMTKLKVKQLVIYSTKFDQELVL